MKNVEFQEAVKLLMEKKYERKDAWSLSDVLLQGTCDEEYKEMNHHDLFIIFEECISRLNSMGMFSLLDDEAISDGDAREGIIHTPTHVIIAWGIYLKNVENQWFTDEINQKFSQLINFVFEYGIFAHGYDGFSSIRKKVMMYLKAGVLDFMKKYPEYAIQLDTYFYTFLSEIQNLASSINPEGIVFKDSGWSNKSCNNDLRKILAYVNGKRIPLFVYGTLMKGQRAHVLMENGIYCDPFLLKDYGMYDLGMYPGIQYKKKETTIGEVYFIDEEMLENIKNYEGSAYKCEKVKVEGFYGDLEAYCFVYKEKINGNIIRIKWNSNPQEDIWYACYGSNLNQDRFKCYIQGGLCQQNQRMYSGCKDKTLWKESECQTFRGRLYFAKESNSWNGKGVAFFDETKYDVVYTRMYRITLEQFFDIQKQEGKTWYGKIVCLGLKQDGRPIYTFTSEHILPANLPDEKYIEVLEQALYKDHLPDKKDVKRYLKRAMK